MRSTAALVKRLRDAEVYTTDDVGEAMYILADGQMVSGNYDHGMRGDDHRSIFAGVDYGNLYESSNPARTHWDRLHRDYRVVRLVPETGYALIRVRQRLTRPQAELLDLAGYEIERY